MISLTEEEAQTAIRVGDLLSEAYELAKQLPVGRECQSLYVATYHARGSVLLWLEEQGLRDNG